jgi:histidyl-tRNA synthetase
LTDIVTKQIYNFIDKGNRDIALRPEGTPGVVRAILQNNVRLPARLFYAGPMFRYERPQKGRYREFYQLGVEVIGEAESITDVEVIEMAVKFFSNLNLTDIIVKVNSVGCMNCRPKFREELVHFLAEHQTEICNDCKVRAEQNPLRVFDCKEEKCQTLYQSAPKVADFLCYDCQEHFQAVLKELVARKVPFELNKMMVRGLDYYTRTTFEFIPTTGESLGSQDSLGGGGRYDNLVEDFGGAKTPAIGFALGLERILLCLGAPSPARKLVYIVPLDAEIQEQGKQLLTLLRNAKIPALLNPIGKPLRAALGVADGLGSGYVIIIGGEEVKKNIYTVKKLADRTQEQVPQDKIIEVLTNK